MSFYRFSLQDFHAIRKADISLDGITVIAGCNGSGKSTIARWLYAFVKYANTFDSLVDDDLYDKVNEILYEMRRILRTVGLIPRELERKIFSPQLKPQPLRNSFHDDSVDYNDLSAEFHRKLDLFCSIMNKEFKNSKRNERLTTWFRHALLNADTEPDRLIETYQEESARKVRKLIEDAEKARETRPTQLLFKFIKKQLHASGSIPDRLGMSENGMDLITGQSFTAPFQLRNAVYVDTPMALSNFSTFDNEIWDDLEEAMSTPLQPMPDSARKVALRIRRIIGGNIELRKDELSRDTDLRYVRKADGLDIPVSEAATGLKSFAYVLRLLENGYLTENSILIIDEPEAHLHPQWIVEFARILVLLNKECNTKILLASHNPDMVAAIKSIATAENVIDRTCFYQAGKEPDSQRFSYRCLGPEIDEIFKSFNIALERIKDYGS